MSKVLQRTRRRTNAETTGAAKLRRRHALPRRNAAKRSRRAKPDES